MNRKIGLLGGIGPEATGEFYLTLISKYQEKGLIHKNEDFPQIVINSIPAPELIFENNSVQEFEPYLRGVEELERWGVDFIALICNTIHCFYDILQKKVRTPILDLRKEMRIFLAERKIKSMVILGTPMTIRKGLYHCEGITCWNLNQGEMKNLTQAIFNFNKGLEKKRQIKIVRSISNKYLKKCDLFVAGCSEIGLMLKNENIPLINPMDVLAEAIVKYSVDSRQLVRRYRNNTFNLFSKKKYAM